MDTSTAQTVRQLALPFPPGPGGALSTPTGSPVAPLHVWATLAPARQAAIRRSLLQLTREVLYDARPQ
jgi:hypothetical protein